MSIRLSLLTLSLGAALLTPFAAQADTYPESHFIAPSGPAKTRAEVTAELNAWYANPAHADGWSELGGNNLRYVGTQTASAKTRAEVQAELVAWRANPLHADGWSEIGGDHSAFTGQQVSGRSRTEVMAERVSGNSASATGIRIAALNGFTLASGLATDEARANAVSTAAQVDKMHVSYATTEGRVAPSASNPNATPSDAKEHLYRLFSAR